MKKLINKKMIALALALTIITTLSFFTACEGGRSETNSDSQPDNSQYLPESFLADLGNGLKIADIGEYTGMYMEDGTDEIVSGVLMMIVKNTSDKTLQYAAFTMPAGENDAKFELTTLPAGQSAVLLEKSRMAFDKDFDYATAVADNTAFFPEEPTKMEDTVKVQFLDGVINVTNISDSDIEGEIVIYYKNSAADLYYGGITYRSRVTGGLAKGETRQIAGGHASKTGSALMFVQII